MARVSSTTTQDGARFSAGEIFADRYRIVGLLGLGGMGEVYRADDLKLGQPVALKFLPDSLAADPERQERFLNEVRLARQVSHPNVCRVYDIGEAQGCTFLSMEYVDGEDLAALLRRIGRLPRDKAVELARQLCAGLAAAHERGVIHRDLKPANVMIDGRGKVRITDFGLAGIAGELGVADARSGTPAYMSPEQLAGREVTLRSDIYALGLVLYEMFTGKKPFEAKGVPELARMHQETAPSSPSTHVEGLDPAVERAILHCLEKDPRDRPRSALAVAAALPGGDPLGAALAAGETPSPEMVAAAGEVGALGPAAAWACLGAMAAGIVLIALLSARTTLVRLVPLEKPPEVLEDTARGIVRKLGYSAAPAGTAAGFSIDQDHLRYVETHDPSRGRWEGLKSGRPAVLSFWYRQSPRDLLPQRLGRNDTVTPDDPPAELAGMASVQLDTLGRLTGFEAVPPQIEEPGAAAPAPDWTELFAMAGLDPSSFKPVEPKWTPPSYADARAAWEGVFPEQPGLALRVEAAAYRARPVSFALIAPWTRASRMGESAATAFSRLSSIIGLLVTLGGLGGGLFLSRRNAKGGRGDRKGAFRLAAYVFIVDMIGWVVRARHVASIDGEMGYLFPTAAVFLFYAAVVWALYIAVEPVVRRRWPDMIISWSRILAGRFRDPLVGRDVLLGVLMGILLAMIDLLYHLAPGWFGLPPQAPHPVIVEALMGPRSLVGSLLTAHVAAVSVSLLFCFLLTLLRVLLRRPRLAAGAFFLLAVLSSVTGSGNPYINVLFTCLICIVLTFTLTRFGLVSTMVTWLLFNGLLGSPITLDFSSWYAGAGLFAVLVALALGVYGFHTALAGRPLFGRALLEAEE